MPSLLDLAKNLFSQGEQKVQQTVNPILQSIQGGISNVVNQAKISAQNQPQINFNPQGIYHELMYGPQERMQTPQFQQKTQQLQAQGAIPKYNPITSAALDYTTNRFSTPLYNTIKSAQDTFAPNKTLLQRGGSAGMTALNALQTQFNQTPLSAGFAGFDAVKSGIQSARHQENPILGAIQGFTGKNVIGAGTALTDNPTGQKLGNAAEFGAFLLHPMAKGYLEKQAGGKAFADAIKKGEAMGISGVSPNVFKIHPEDQTVMENFINAVRSGKGKQNLGDVGVEAQAVIEHYFGNNWSNISNDKMANAFEWALDTNRGVPEAARMKLGNVPRSNLVEDAGSVVSKVRANLSSPEVSSTVGQGTEGVRTLPSSVAQPTFYPSIENTSQAQSKNPILSNLESQLQVKRSPLDNPTIPQSTMPDTGVNPLLKQPNGVVQDTSLPIAKQNGEALPQQQITPSEQLQPGANTQPLQEQSKNQVSSFIDSAKSKANELYTKTLDRFNPISQLGKQAGQNQKIENAMTGYYGAASTANYHVDFELAPILKESNPQDLRTIAIAQRDLELAGRDIKGSTAQADAQKNLQELQQRLGPEGYQKLQGTLKNLYSYQDKLVQDYLVKTGIISPEAYAQMKSNNQSYVPFKRVMDTVDEQLGFSPGKQAGSVSSQNVIKGIKGSTKEVIDPLQSIVDNTYKIVGVAKRQQVAQSIVNLKDALPEGVISKLEGTVGNKATISLFENGKQVKYQVPQEVADAAKGMTEDQMSTVVKLLSAPTKVFRATATGLNPEFMVPNVMRDLQNAFVNVGLNPFKFVKGMASLMNKDELYQDFLKSGGQTSTVSLDRPFLQTRVGEITGEKGLITDKMPKLFEWIQKAGEYSEQPTRIAAFDQAKQKFLAQGLSAEEASVRAANAAQESTVNFARRGSDTRSLNAVYAFLNARAQGVDRLVRSIKNDPKGAGTRMAFLAAAPAIALYANNRRFKSYFDDRVVTQNDKKNNFILMLSDTPIDKLGGAQYIKIPKSEVGQFANPVENFMSWVDGKGGDASSAMMSALASFSPVNNAGDLIPTAVRPIAENAANRNFFTGQELVPSYKQNLPPSAQFGSTTAPLFKAIGDKTNQSPAKLQNLAEGYGTGYTKIAEQLTQPILPGYTSAKNDRGADINRTPILRRFAGGEKKSPEEVKTDAINRVKSIKADMSQIRNGIKKGTVNEKQGNEKIQQLQKDLGVQQGYIKGPEQSSAFAGKVAASDMPIQTPLTPFGGQNIKDGTTTPAIDPQQTKDIKSNIRLGISVTPDELKSAYLGSDSSTTNKYQTSLKQSDLLSKLGNIEKMTTLSDSQKKILTDEIVKRTGLKQDQIDYYKTAKQNTNQKTLYVLDQIDKTPNEKLINQLTDWRQVVNGQQILSDAVINNLVSEGKISDTQASALKKIDYTPSGALKIAKPKKPKKITIKAAKVPKIKLKKVSVKPIKIKAPPKPTKLKVKQPKMFKIKSPKKVSLKL